MYYAISLFLPINLIAIFILYLYLFNKRKIIGLHLGMNIAMVTGGGMALGTGVILITLFPLKYLLITIVAAILGMCIGSLFGGLFDYQTLLTGYINGAMMGIMAPMVGAAASDSLLFVCAIELFILASFILLISSSKTS